MSQSIVCDNCQSRLKLREGKTSFRGTCPKCGNRIDWTATPADDAASSESKPTKRLPTKSAVSKPASNKTSRSTPATDEFDPTADFEPVEYRPLSSLPPRAGSGKSARSSGVANSMNHQTRDAEILRRLLAGFDGAIPRRSPGFGYRLTLVVTACAIVLLMLLYLAIIAATGYGIYWYATTILPTGLQFRGRVTVFVMLFHIAVVLGGLSTLLSLILPLIPSRADDDEERSVSISEAPLLHSFVAKIAETLGSPPPAEIHVSLDVNASAGYRGGLWGLFRKRLVLTIGAPLIAGLNTQQLGGIVAHELGHFSQRGGFALQHFISLFVVWCLAMIGLLLTMFVARRQEFDADRYEAQLAGSDTFFETVRRLVELSMGQMELMKRGASYLFTTLTSANGIGNLAAEIVTAADAMAKSNQAIKQIEKRLQAPTGWFDSHPSDRDRIAAVKANPQQGVFHLQDPAWELYPRLNPNP